MKKLLLLSVLLTIPLFVNSKNTFTIKDDLGVIASYEVTPRFLEHFASFVRQQSSESRPFLADIYRALQNGRDISYNKDRNSIGGMLESDWTSLTPKELKKFHGNANSFDATFNSKKQRFYVALRCLASFYY